MPTLLFALLLAASPEERREAKRLFQQGSQEYAAGAFATALDDFTKASRLDAAPAVQFNLAQCHRAMSHWSQAAFYYRSYLSQKPEAPNRAETLARIDEMDVKALLAQSAGATAPPPLTVAADPNRPTSRPAIGPNGNASTAPLKPAAPLEATASAPAAPLEAYDAFETTAPVDAHPWPAGIWWLGGSGAALLVGGIVFGAINLSGPAPTKCLYGECVDTTRSNASLVNTSAYVAPVLLATGGAMLLTSAIWALLTPNGSTSNDARP